MLCNAGYPTYLIGNFVRGKQAITLKHAVKHITSEPARFFGMSDRGELVPDWRRTSRFSISIGSAHLSVLRSAMTFPAADAGW